MLSLGYPGVTMHRWQVDDEPESGRSDVRDGERERGSRGQRAIRALLGQALIVVLVGGVVWFRFNQTPSAPVQQIATTGAASSASQPAPPASISARADVEVPADVSAVGDRFLQALARGDVSGAAADVAKDGKAPSLSSITLLNSTATPFQATRSRSFRVQFWQPATSTELARLVIGFDYDRPETSNGRSRVTLRMLQQNDRWYITDVDIAAWMQDLGLPPR